MAVSSNLFQPTRISGLQLWLDASDQFTLFQDSAGTAPANADGDPIGCWKDKSGNAKHATQSDGTKKPLLKLAQKNGRNVLLFDGTNDSLKNSVGLTTGTYSGIVHVIYAATRSATPGTVFNERISFPARCFIWAYWSQTSGLYEVSSDGISKVNRITSTDYYRFAQSGAVISHLGSGSAADSIRVNGTQISLTTNYYWDIWGDNGYLVGERESGYGQYWNGQIFEILAFTSALSDQNIQLLENYLLVKWGIV